MNNNCYVKVPITEEIWQLVCQLTLTLRVTGTFDVNSGKGPK